jgi:CBS domain-containing protein
MKDWKIRDLMVPIADYASIHQNATMAEAMNALENENKVHEKGPYRHQSLVVVDDNNHVVGRLSIIDMMRSFEPRYTKLGKSSWIGKSFLSKEVLVTLRENFQLWEQPIEEMCKTIADAKVSDYMQEPTEGEFVAEDDTMNVAMHRTVMGRHHSLLVTRGMEIVGILRSTDLFNAVYDKLSVCA